MHAEVQVITAQQSVRGCIVSTVLWSITHHNAGSASWMSQCCTTVSSQYTFYELQQQQDSNPRPSTSNALSWELYANTDRPLWQPSNHHIPYTSTIHIRVMFRMWRKCHVFLCFWESITPKHRRIWRSCLFLLLRERNSQTWYLTLPSSRTVLYCNCILTHLFQQSEKHIFVHFW